MSRWDLYLRMVVESSWDARRARIYSRGVPLERSGDRRLECISLPMKFAAGENASKSREPDEFEELWPGGTELPRVYAIR